uniref:Uncharacterized protein n=1 Tax=Anguilla anguilla TaxID=7936 RepID=A0A0E9W5Q4_ANGAN
MESTVFAAMCHACGLKGDQASLSSEPRATLGRVSISLALFEAYQHGVSQLKIFLKICC